MDGQNRSPRLPNNVFLNRAAQQIGRMRKTNAHPWSVVAGERHARP